jgi:glutamine amidotransferase
MSDVLIISYGMGNLRSVANAFESFGLHPLVSSDPADLRSAERIVLPGVGAFIDGMNNLRAGGWIEPLAGEVLGRGKPFLGICLGMQLLATTGLEGGETAGLNFIPGIAGRIESDDPEVRVPHIGWNDVQFRQQSPRRSSMYAGLGESQAFYFVHSYVLRPDDREIINGTCHHGIEFCASIESGNIWATQYHPEKSQKAGLAVMRNFIALDRTGDSLEAAPVHPVSQEAH